MEELPAALAARILSRIELLALNPRPSGVVKLRGGSVLWRLRVGDYRIVYSIDDAAKVVDVSVVRHRREVYRGV